MNYLAHYYFFGRKSDPYYNCGLIFPDWLGAYGRRKFIPHIQAEGPGESALKEGILHHYKGDKIFHGSAFFSENAHGIKSILEQTSLDKERLRFAFLSHLLLEMTIDRLLLKRNRNTGTEFYESLDQCDTNRLLAFAIKNSTCDEGFRELMNRFKEHRFLLHYIKNDTFVYSLNRIIGRVGLQMSAGEMKELEAILPLIEELIEKNWHSLTNLFEPV